MTAWFSANIGTILIGLALAAVVAAAITVLLKDRKKGKCSCGGSCGHCPMSGSCHNR